MDDDQGLLAPHSGIDRATLDTLREMLGDDAVVVDIVETFLRETPLHLRGFEQALASGDVPAARAEAHGIKGSAQILGALRLAELCAAFEVDPGAESADRVLQEYEHVARELRALVARMRTD